MLIYLSALLLSLSLAVYSYALIDPNITFFQNNLWVAFRDVMVQFGYYQREQSSMVFLILVGLFFILWYVGIKNYKKINPLKIALIIGGALIFSYPFLSHDFFNYMFDAKIFTFYHQNPYAKIALDFQGDQWLRFMHWTHRTYPYGPSYLLISFIPSFLGFGKFSVTFLLFKLLHFAMYAVSIWLLNKLNRHWATSFAMNPLIIMEGLVNGHNDLIGLSLAVIGIYYLLKKRGRDRIARIFFLLSGAIKYLNAPVILFQKKGIWNLVSYIFQIMLIGYLVFSSEIQPWYFLALFAYIPFFKNALEEINIFIFGLIVSYYPYIRFGGWDTKWKVDIKHQIILFFFGVNMAYILIRYIYRWSLYTRKAHS